MKTFKPNTIGGRIVTEMEAQGYVHVGTTSGWYSYRSNSNLSRYLKHLNLTREQVAVKRGAKKRHKTQGTDLLIFVKEGGR